MSVFAYVAYGAYAHEPGEVEYSISREATKDQFDRINGYKERWDLSGELLGDDASDIDDKVQALAAAYSVGGYDLRLILPGGASSYHYLRSADCFAGTQIVKPLSFPSNRGAAYANSLAYAVSIEGEIKTNDDEELLVSFEETLEFTGGGPRRGFIETVDAQPVEQLLRRFTIYRATQSGRAVGLYQRPTPPGPIFPNNEFTDQRRIGKIAPTLENNTLKNWGVTWSYTYESATPLRGEPTLPS